ncbi:MAG: MucBP domain-containing protein [Streptococcaceae bacterium]|nr:MucBP domain-containing protein [Streptococcaceae bacterium]
MKRKHILSLAVLLLLAACIGWRSPKVQAGTPNFGAALFYSFDGDNYRNISWNQVSDINLKTTSTIYIQEKLIATSNGTLTNRLWSSFTNADASGNEWFTFADYPTLSGSSNFLPLVKMIYTTDGINYTDTKPPLSELKGVKVTLNGTLTSPESDGSNPFVSITAPLIPKKDDIINNNMLNQPMFPVTGQYSIFYDWSIQDWFYELNSSMIMGQFQFLNPALPGKAVTVLYQDENGKEIATPETLNGNIGDAYTAEQKSISGYTFKEVQGNANGTFTDQAQTVIYVYRMNQDFSSIIVHDSNLTVGEHWDAQDNFDSATDYWGNPVDFSNIIVSGDVDTSKAGIYKVTYTRGVPNFFSDSENHGIYSAIATIKVSDKLPDKGNVIINYVDEAGKTLSKSIVLSGDVGESYSSEQKRINGYTFKEIHGNANGQFTHQTQNIIYIYKKDTVLPSAPKPATPTSTSKKGTHENKSIDKKVENKKLPTTGDSPSEFLLVFGGALIVISLGVLLFRKIQARFINK